MKRIILCAILAVIGTVGLTSCKSTDTTVPRDTASTSTTRTYSK